MQENAVVDSFEKGYRISCFRNHNVELETYVN
jgi:hypothetical protein